MPKPNVDPVSRASNSTTSSRRLSRTSAARRNIPWRAPGGVCDQAGNASAAASIARRASSRPADATMATTSPVYGSRFSNDPPPVASTQSPPMWRRRSVVSIVVIPTSFGSRCSLAHRRRRGLLRSRVPGLDLLALDLPVHVRAQVREVRELFRRDLVTRPRQVDPDDLLHLRGRVGEDDDAVGEI